MFYAQIKYHRQAFPVEYEFATKERAGVFCQEKENHNPYVRWTGVVEKREYPSKPLGGCLV